MKDKFTKTIDPNLMPLVAKVKAALRKWNLVTVCDSARCPNQYECYSGSNVTFMILGTVCTRSCRFCSVKKGKTALPDSGEPSRIAAAINEIGLKYAVITSVTRDDLADYGAGQFIDTVVQIREKNKGLKIELLIPDFNGNSELIKKVALTDANVIGHNVETVERFYGKYKPESSYDRSIYVIHKLKQANPQILTKSALMVGLGEEKREVFKVLKDLKGVDCDMAVIGQYLCPSKAERPAQRTATREEFGEYEAFGREIGISVMAGHFARSSYMAEEFYKDYSSKRGLNA